MSNASRLGIVAVAAIVAILAFLAFQPDEDEAADTAAAPVTVTATEPAPAGPGTTATAPAQTTPAETTPAPPPEPEVPTVRFRDGEVVGGVRELEFESGEQVRFRVVSDVAEEIHVHGYDRYVDLRPGVPRTVRFPAELEGVFEVELHGTGTQIAELRVAPR